MNPYKGVELPFSKVYLKESYVFILQKRAPVHTGVYLQPPVYHAPSSNSSPRGAGHLEDSAPWQGATITAQSAGCCCGRPGKQ